MATALTPLATTTLASASATVTFSSISGAYRDLRLVTTTRHASQGQPYNQLRFRFNGDSGANYNFVSMKGTGSTTESSSATNQVELALFFDAPNTSSSFSPIITDIMDYSATDKHKTSLIRLNDAEVSVQAIAGRWASTSAINSITVYAPTDNWVAGSTFSLYGIVS